MSKAVKQAKALEKHFEQQHNNPPPPFNPHYHPKAQSWLTDAAASMEADGFYDNHTRAECAVEIRKRYEELRKKCLEGEDAEET